MANTPSKTGLDPDKYKVIRPEEDYGTHGRPEEVIPSNEVFVLRRGDVLATAALRSYVQNALLMLDVDEDMRRDGRIGILDAHEHDHLRALADDISSLATDWEEYNHGKLPD